jgi:hypothetical protein
MSKAVKAGLGAVVLTLMVAMLGPRFSTLRAGEVPSGGYRVLAPITRGNLAIFPVVAATTHDTTMFITLDEGLRAGTVVITEVGQEQGLRRRPVPYRRPDGAQVNRLELVNNSDRALILLAGEIVSGGKQDRVVGKDRIIPPQSDPVDLSVFCVEPGRWTAVSQNFGGTGTGRSGGMGTAAAAPVPMAQPSVRSKAMADKDQAKVWSSVGEVNGRLNPGAPVPSTSYPQAMASKVAKERIDAVAAPVEESFSGVLRKLHEQKAVGVVVAIGGEIVWADIFASTPLLEKYWPKLARSYAAESLTTSANAKQPSQSAAQAFLEQMAGNKETVESEPGVYRHTEIYGAGYRAFELASLLPKTGFDVHLSKMSEYFGTEKR